MRKFLCNYLRKYTRSKKYDFHGNMCAKNTASISANICASLKIPCKYLQKYTLCKKYSKKREKKPLAPYSLCLSLCAAWHILAARHTSWLSLS